MGGLKVVLADDHELMRGVVRMMLEQKEAFEVVGEASTGSEVLPLVARTQPDLVLLDVEMPGADGLTLLAQIRERHPGVKVVILSAFDDPRHIAAALRRGASGYVLKSVGPTDLASVLRQAVEGTVFHAISSPWAESEAAVKAAGLSEKEHLVLKQLALGRANKEIAKELWVSEQTVKFHLRRIYRKLGVATRTDAVRYAYEHDVVEAPVVDQA